MSRTSTSKKVQRVTTSSTTSSTSSYSGTTLTSSAPTSPTDSAHQRSSSSSSYFNKSSKSPTSQPTSPSFLTTALQTIRERSRSRSSVPRSRSPSPLQRPANPTIPAARAVSTGSRPAINPIAPHSPTGHGQKRRWSDEKLVRRTSGGTGDRAYSYGMGGRHSNEWLFGGVSVTETLKNVLRRESPEGREEKR